MRRTVHSPLNPPIKQVCSHAHEQVCGLILPQPHAHKHLTVLSCKQKSSARCAEILFQTCTRAHHGCNLAVWPAYFLIWYSSIAHWFSFGLRTAQQCCAAPISSLSHSLAYLSTHSHTHLYAPAAPKACGPAQRPPQRCSATVAKVGSMRMLPMDASVHRHSVLLHRAVPSNVLLQSQIILFLMAWNQKGQARVLPGTLQPLNTECYFLIRTAEVSISNVLAPSVQPELWTH